ncbi:MAG: hypothetical protein ACK5PF_08330 [bacterium]
MTDYPMIFSAPMVRALQAGIKTQTRRIITPGNSLFNGGKWSDLHKRQEWDWKGAWVDGGPSPMGNPGPYLKLPWKAGDDDFEDTVHRIYPVIQPGDRIWVKEAWRTEPKNDDLLPSGLDPATAAVWFDASSDWQYDYEKPRYRHARFMPRWASRTTLTVTDVRPQRVQDISEADSVAEGATAREKCSGLLGRETGWSMDWSRVGQLSAYAFRPPGGPAKTPLKESDISLCDPKMAFASYFNSLHGPDAWARNDWVWAYSFSVHHGNIDSIGDRG